MLKNNIKDKLKNGGIIIFPTDTVYGMACLPTKKFIEKIHLIKKRDKDKKIVALVDSKERAKEILEYDKITYALIDKFFPGPFTIIAKGKKDFLNNIGYNDIGIRMPANRIAKEILKEVGGILMTTSVNISGENPASSIKDIDENILKEVDLIIENEEEVISKRASSIFKIINGNIELVRKGDISLEEVLKYKEEIKFEK